MSEIYLGSANVPESVGSAVTADMGEHVHKHLPPLYISSSIVYNSEPRYDNPTTS